MNEIQKTTFAMIKEAICNGVGYSSVRYDAIKVVTPFIDWIGEPVSVYITEEGTVTDGEKTLNQIKALRAYEDFKEWSEGANYFEDYNINPLGNSLDIKYIESPEDILRYLQGVSRLPMLFEVNPISDKEDRFPTRVRTDVMEALMSQYPNRPRENTLQWAHKLSHSYSFFAKNGIRIHSDMRPKNKNKNVQIIGMASSSDGAKRAHVASKLYNPLQWEKTNNNVQTVIVVYDSSKYPTDSQDAMIGAGVVIECKEGISAINDICIQVAEA